MNHLLLNILLIFSLFLPQLSNGQEVKGVIRDANSKPIPFASIYNAQLQKGTTANMEGEYQLFLPAGEHE
ncbi:MAG: carboxypeptidase-like regulatory domain-containing protein, partial [Bacteroidales bacterium]|nr:carboxypeptidase-like regulatory domain-containing protein [Bacteroidales bacterium]